MKERDCIELAKTGPNNDNIISLDGQTFHTIPLSGEDKVTIVGHDNQVYSKKIDSAAHEYCGMFDYILFDGKYWHEKSTMPENAIFQVQLAHPPNIIMQCTQEVVDDIQYDPSKCWEITSMQGAIVNKVRAWWARRGP